MLSQSAIIALNIIYFTSIIKAKNALLLLIVLNLNFSKILCDSLQWIYTSPNESCSQGMRVFVDHLDSSFIAHHLELHRCFEKSYHLN